MYKHNRTGKNNYMKSPEKHGMRYDTFLKFDYKTTTYLDDYEQSIEYLPTY